ncbi:hypothetical protein KUTeg_009000 [Tegillarca granosa]|uniref:Uncharacterized protein n=1 Tax=Tegillarca granosa TaxID=220873 RepID=A0ABQ9F7V3_TEGGR|nr:hypothetical protein KUTeg_009000 [Tegillarca granosa]
MSFGPRKALQKNAKAEFNYTGVACILTSEAGVTDLAVIQVYIFYWTRLVKEVTDDKSLHWKERKRLQIEHAPNCSFKAKLVKLADKLYNLRDLCRQSPQGWSDERVHEYFIWASKVIAGLRGTNKPMEDALDKINQLLRLYSGFDHVSRLDIFILKTEA